MAKKITAKEIGDNKFAMLQPIKIEDRSPIGHKPPEERTNQI